MAYIIIMKKLASHNYYKRLASFRALYEFLYQTLRNIQIIAISKKISQNQQFFFTLLNFLSISSVLTINIK